MKVDLNNILDKEDLEFDIKLNSEIENIFSTTLDGLCHVNASIKRKEDNSLIITLKIKQLLLFACFKCLDLVKFHLLHDVEEELNEDSEFIESNILDLEELINQEVFLNIPSRVVCKPDCKGLCPTCGTNMNLKTCSCKQEDVNEDNPFKKLEELIFED